MRPLGSRSISGRREDPSPPPPTGPSAPEEPPPRPDPTGPAPAATRRRPLRAGARRAVYALLSLPLALVYLLLFAALVVSVATIGVGVGVLLLPGVLAAARGLAGLERRQAHALLDVAIPPGPRLRRETGPALPRLRGLVVSPGTWRALAWLGVRMLCGASVLAAAVVAMSAAVLVLFDLGWPAAVLLILLPVLVTGLARALDVQARIAAGVAPRLLGPGSQEQLAALRRRSQQLADGNRLARDLHDTIGHALTASLLQARAARRTLVPHAARPDAPPDAAFARQALAHIETNTTHALAELDRALALLRNVAAGPAGPQAPDLGRLDTLLDGLRAGGLPVDVSLDAPRHEMTAEVSEAVYRIVQEGTTNVLKHAGCVATSVRIACHDGHLTVLVRNAAARPRIGRSPEAGGRGLAGLRERVAALGGQLTAGATPDGGFDLVGRVPLRAGS